MGVQRKSIAMQAAEHPCETASRRRPSDVIAHRASPQGRARESPVVVLQHPVQAADVLLGDGAPLAVGHLQLLPVVAVLGGWRLGVGLAGGWDVSLGVWSSMGQGLGSSGDARAGGTQLCCHGGGARFEESNTARPELRAANKPGPPCWTPGGSLGAPQPCGRAPRTFHASSAAEPSPARNMARASLLIMVGSCSGMGLMEEKVRATRMRR